MDDHRDTLTDALRIARRRLSPAQRATRGQQRRWHIWMDAATILDRIDRADLSSIAVDRAYKGWTPVDPFTALELEKD
jgi:hypothetical protein